MMKNSVIFVLMCLLLGFVQAQETVKVIAGLETHEALAAETVGNTVHTSALICTDKTVLESVINVLAEQANLNTEPQLSEELSRQVDDSCLLDDAVDLEFVALGASQFAISFPLEATGFVQTSQIGIAEVKLTGYQLNKVHSLQGGSVALKGAYTDFNQSAYFAVLESVKVAKP